jgi:Putative binding domain, N-terminal/Viral BACON domain
MTNLRAGLIGALVLALASSGCGSSTSTSTAPSTVPRCSVSLPTPELNVPASGGKGTVAVSTNRECAWTANSTASWLTISGTASGQGDGTVEYVAAANSDPASRRGVIELNDQRANITQAAADCVMQLADPSESFTPAGGSGTIGVRASSGICTWTAVSDSSWITIRSGASGTGNGTVAYDVAAATGAPRTGTVLVAGLRFSITQSQSCTYSVAPTSYSPAPGGGSTIVNVSTAAGCPWTAASNVPWATVVQGATGTGPGAAQVVVDGTSGPTRTGSVLVAGQLVTITQGGGCSFSADPLSLSFGAQGGTGTATITAGSGCAWTAASDSPWITLMGSTSGTGGGGISFAVSPVSGPARSGTITVAGIQVTVSQSAGCTVTLGSAGQQLEAAGGDVSVSVAAAAGCAWTAASNVSWITVASGGSGTGDGTVKLTVAPTSTARSGTVTIAGQTFTVNQQGSGSSCTFSIDPKSANVPASGGTGSVQLATSAGCAWTATSNASWLTITSGGSGSGPGNVGFSAAAMTGGPRSGTLTVGGQTFTVNQGNGCAFSIAPTSTNIAASGGNSSFEVAAGVGCAWTATSSDAWLTITSGGTGSGGGTVQFAAASTNGGPRSATITVADQTFTVNQGGGCSFSIAPTSTSVAAGGGNGTVTVTAGNGCDWTATSNASWLSVTSGANGSGNGTVRFTAASTNGGSRSGTITIAGQTFTVNQGSGCSFSLSQSSANAAAGGGTGGVAVTAGGGCSWTAASNASWLTITSGGSGSGNGTVQYSAAANAGGARSGTLTIAGHTFTVNQASGCSISISSTSANVPEDGIKNASVTVTAAGGCAWTAVSNVPWIDVTSGASDTGNGTVRYTVDATTGPARSGTLTIGGHTFTVNQASGCTYQVSPATFNSVPALGATRSVTVTTAAGCTWTTTPHVSWITVTNGASGNGNGTVTLAIAANLVGSRSGTVTVAGQTVTVNQLGVIGLDPAPQLAARTPERSADSGYPDRVQETEHRSAGRKGEQRR